MNQEATCKWHMHLSAFIHLGNLSTLCGLGGLNPIAQGRNAHEYDLTGTNFRLKLIYMLYTVLHLTEETNIVTCYFNTSFTGALWYL